MASDDEIGGLLSGLETADLCAMMAVVATGPLRALDRIPLL